MKYVKRCKVIVFQNKNISSFRIVYPVTIKGKMTANGRQFAVSSPTYSHRNTRNEEINKFKKLLNLEEVKREVENFEQVIR